MKKSTKTWIFGILIVLVAILDSGSQIISNFFPVIGQVLDSISNGVFEIIELALVYGLWSTK